ncbi:PH domain-containing protein [Eremococcus coleocola]|uniref:PH domain-containing protein n=1 Tax=Eremococcus coleocola TaxID=88132 RepID=UPI00115CEB84|nr:PH domain-containing protein [Eremococcus coleocola]
MSSLISQTGFFNFNTMLIPFMLLHLAPVWYAIFGPIWRAIRYRTIEYVITNRRVYISGGIFGRDVTSIDYRDIEDLTVNVNPLERLKGKGTLKLTRDYSTNTGSNYSVSYGVRFKAIDNPYQVYKLLKKVALDVYTDQNYPNAYGPEDNSGYNTMLD